MKVTKTYRTAKAQRIYEQQMALMKGETACRMCAKVKKPLKRLGSFVIAPNDFKYDRISDINDMLILKSHKDKLTNNQKLEMFRILEKLDRQGFYNHFMGNFPKRSSIPGHYHIHLFKFDRNG